MSDSSSYEKFDILAEHDPVERGDRVQFAPRVLIGHSAFALSLGDSGPELSAFPPLLPPCCSCEYRQGPHEFREPLWK